MVGSPDSWSVFNFPFHAVGVLVGALSGYFGGCGTSFTAHHRCLPDLPHHLRVDSAGRVPRAASSMAKEQHCRCDRHHRRAVMMACPSRARTFPCAARKEFVTASRALGGSHARLIIHHIRRIALGQFWSADLNGSAIITESGLSYRSEFSRPPPPGVHFHRAEPGLSAPLDRIFQAL